MTSTDTVHPPTAREQADLLDALQTHRQFLRQTASGLSDEQARLRSTVSFLSVGGIIKHVTDTERGWARFIAGNGLPSGDIDWSNVDWSNPDPALFAEREIVMTMLPEDTLDNLLAKYEQVAAATDALIATLDPNVEYPLPPAPWFPPDTSWSIRRAVVHIVAETAQHAGHADIIRETIDGQKTMG